MKKRFHFPIFDWNRQRLSFRVFHNKKMILCLLLATAFLQMQCGSSEGVTSVAPDKEQVLPVSEDVFDESWLEAKSGNIPLVISAPHGGTISPEQIPDRVCGTKERDNNTAQLAFEIENAFKQNGKQPYLIVAQIARTKIDLNRNIDEATCGNSIMNDTWNRYHNHIEVAIAKAIEEFGYVLYIDLHGQSHPIKRLELGYNLSKSELKDNYDETGSNVNNTEKSSLKNLLKLNSKLNLRELLIGKNAFGTLMEKAGFPSVPSLDDPFPHPDDPYFNGGYNTRRYTSSDYPNVFGLQIEANFQGVRDTEENRKRFSGAFAQSIISYLDYIDALN